MKERLSQLNEELKGTRTVRGELKIQGFNNEAYEQLYEYLLEELAEIFDGNFWGWYEKICVSYIRFRQANARRLDFYCPQTRNVFEHSIREQLAVIRWYIYKRNNSSY